MLRRFCLLLGLAAIACASDDDPVSEAGAASDEGVAVLRSRLPAFERQVWLFVVDDADTAAAIALREAVVNAMRLPEGGPYDADENACPGSDWDPSHEDPIDIRVIVAHPGEDESIRLVTPNEIPELARLGERDDVEAQERWANAVKSELLRAPVSALGRYAPLETVADTLSLLAGQRLPWTLQEERQLQSLSPLGSSFVEIFFMTTRDDASPSDPLSYDIVSYCDWDADAGLCPNFRALLLGQNGEYIRERSVAEKQQMTRIGEYFGRLESSNFLDVAWDPDQFFYPILFVKQGSTCWESPPIRRDDGTVDCRIHILSSDLSACDPVRGWLDPLAEGAEDRAPKTELHDTWGDMRVCEIRQLEGADLERCLLHPDEAQPTAGFCYPVPSESCRSSTCGEERPYPVSVRFVAGSTRVTSHSLLRYACRLESTQYALGP